MSGSKTWFGLGGLLTVAMMVGSLVMSGNGVRQSQQHDLNIVESYATIAAMKQVCSLTEDEEEAVNAALAEMTPGMSESEINLARSLAGTRGLALSGETDRTEMCDAGFDALWARSGETR